MPPTIDDYGSDSYTYIAGQRLKVGIVRTLRPRAGDTNETFQDWMEALALKLESMPSVLSVETEFERRDKAIVECVLRVRYTPRPDPIAADSTPAGGRVERGKRAA